MSEEQNQVEVKEEKGGFNPSKVVILFTVLSFLFSSAALITSSVALNGAPASNAQNGQVVISKQYDRGKSLNKAMATDKPIIVFFYTDWCGFCQKFAPVFDKITKARKFKSKFAVAYVNCENPDNQRIMQEFQIEGFPTVYVIDNQGRRTKLENNILFEENSVEIVTKKAMELIGEGESEAKKEDNAEKSEAKKEAEEE